MRSGGLTAAGRAAHYAELALAQGGEGSPSPSGSEHATREDGGSRSAAPDEKGGDGDGGDFNFDADDSTNSLSLLHRKAHSDGDAGAAFEDGDAEDGAQARSVRSRLQSDVRHGRGCWADSHDSTTYVEEDEASTSPTHSGGSSIDTDADE